jgi:hypothetical protein
MATAAAGHWWQKQSCITSRQEFVKRFIGCLPMPDADPRRVVLVVEDETLVRMFMTDFLDEAGFKVFEAGLSH